MMSIFFIKNEVRPEKGEGDLGRQEKMSNS